MKNPAGELLDAGEGGHVGHRVVAGGDHHVVEPGDSGGGRSRLGSIPQISGLGSAHVHRDLAGGPDLIC